MEAEISNGDEEYKIIIILEFDYNIRIYKIIDINMLKIFDRINELILNKINLMVIFFYNLKE